jgi:hypothetical protein
MDLNDRTVSELIALSETTHRVTDHGRPDPVTTWGVAWVQDGLVHVSYGLTAHRAWDVEGAKHDAGFPVRLFRLNA